MKKILTYYHQICLILIQRWNKVEHKQLMLDLHALQVILMTHLERTENTLKNGLKVLLYLLHQKSGIPIILQILAEMKNSIEKQKLYLISEKQMEIWR